MDIDIDNIEYMTGQLLLVFIKLLSFILLVFDLNVLFVDSVTDYDK